MYSSRLRTAVIEAAYIVSALLFFFLPRMVGWAGRLVLAFFLPTMAVAICVLFRQIASRDPLRVNYRRYHDTYELVLNAAVIFIVGLHFTLVGSLIEGPRRWIGRLPFALIGVLLVIVGCALRRVRPNLAVEILKPWTLHTQRIWSGTHRVGGYSLAAFGALILACTVLAPHWLVNLVVYGAIAGTVALIGLYYWSWRSQLGPDSSSSDSRQK